MQTAFYAGHTTCITVTSCQHRSLLSVPADRIYTRLGTPGPNSALHNFLHHARIYTQQPTHSTSDPHITSTMTDTISPKPVSVLFVCLGNICTPTSSLLPHHD